MGVPRFKKLPNEASKEKNIYSYSTKNIPEFQSLPSSTSEKFETLTKVETFPSESENFSDIDLKGHTIEELAAAANVNKDVILSAIKIRRQQMKIEKKSSMISEKNYPSTFVSYPTETTVSTTKSETKSESTTHSPTIKLTTTTPATITYVTKKKLKKHPLNGSHKVNENIFYKIFS